MGSKLWFITNGVSVIGVSDNKDDAQYKMEKFQYDPDYAYYDCYDIEIDELDDYPEELDIAMDKGYIS